MIKGFTMRKILLLASAISFCGNSYASAFQLWGLDASSIGNDHADRAVITNASTSYYNPAGLIQIKNQQFVMGLAPSMTDIRFHGTQAVNTLANTSPQPVSVQGGSYRTYPFLHYAAPIADTIVFGLSIVEPFGFKTNYGNTTLARYTSTLDTLDVYDFTPSLSFSYGDKFSWGVGIDCERLKGEFDYSTTAAGQTIDTVSTNSGNDWAYGYHLGILYRFSPQSRVGLSYHSSVTHKLSGTSKFIGSLASGIQTANFKSEITLPATTTLSGFHQLNSHWDIMGNVSFTQWTATSNLNLKNIVGLQGGALTQLQVPIIQSYQNTWNFSIGTHYHVNDKLLLRAGIGYDESPTSNHYRNLILPDSDQIAMAIGTFIQATENMGFNVGWTHLFYMNTRINHVSQAAGDQIATTNGTVKQGADIFGLDMKWDIL